MLNMEKRIAIAGKINALPEGAKEADAYQQLYGDQVTLDQLATVRAAIRLDNFEEIVSDVMAIPKEELEGMNLQQIHDRLYSDQVSRNDFRTVWIEERSAKKPKAAAEKKAKTEPKPQA